MEKAIIAKNVTKKYKLYKNMKERLLDLITPLSYGEDFYALANVSFEAEKGDVIGFIGVNGSGKVHPFQYYRRHRPGDIRHGSSERGSLLNCRFRGIEKRFDGTGQYRIKMFNARFFEGRDQKAGTGYHRVFGAWKVYRSAGQVLFQRDEIEAGVRHFRHHQSRHFNY